MISTALWIRLSETSVDWPEDSLEKRILAPAPTEDRMATKKTTTPNPPIHWLIQRQNKRLRGNASKFVNTEEPVVVKPEVDSKKASIRLQSGRIRK